MFLFTLKLYHYNDSLLSALYDVTIIFIVELLIHPFVFPGQNQVAFYYAVVFTVFMGCI